MNFADEYQGLRNSLVQELKEKGITDQAVLKAIGTIPRHQFFDSIFLHKAYKNIAFPIGSGQTISRPHTVAFQTELLQLKKGEKVLEIGTGSGYQSAVLVFLGAKLYTIERQYDLFKTTQFVFEKIGYIPEKFVWGDGYKGLPQQAPFDKIIVTAGAATLPEDLLLQLSVGGRMVIPLGEGKQIMTTFDRISEVDFVKKEYGTFEFVPMLSEKENYSL